MDCQKIKESLWLYVAKETDAAESRAVEEHLRGCPACSAEVKKQSLALRALPPLPELSEAYWDAYTQKILDRLKDRRRSPAPAWRWAAATALGAFVFVGVFVYRHQQDKARESQEVIANLEVLENLDVLSREDFETEAANEGA